MGLLRTTQELIRHHKLERSARNAILTFDDLTWTASFSLERLKRLNLLYLGRKCGHLDPDCVDLEDKHMVSLSIELEKYQAFVCVRFPAEGFREIDPPIYSKKELAWLRWFAAKEEISCDPQRWTTSAIAHHLR